jgi:hypothetical protein
VEAPETQEEETEMIQEGSKTNLETLRLAFEQGHVALTECIDLQTGEPVVVICAVNLLPDAVGEFVPLAKLFNGDPYEEVIPAWTEQQPLPMGMPN